MHLYCIRQQVGQGALEQKWPHHFMVGESKLSPCGQSDTSYHRDIHGDIALEFFIGHRVSAESELNGLDIPEMGQLGYPEFVFRPEPVLSMAA